MTAHSYQLQQFRIIREVAYGTTPAGTFKRLLSYRIMPAAVFEVDPFMPSGYTAATLAVVNDDFTEADIEGRADYNGIIYPLASMFGDPTISNLGGSPVAYSHVYTWDGKTPLRPASFTCEYGEPDDADRVKGFIFNGLGISGGRGGFELSGTGFGKAMEADIGVLTGVTKEVQTLATDTPTPSGGTFALTFKGFTTAAIVYNASAAAVVSALEALPSIGAGGVTATGGSLPGTPVVITMHGHLAGVDQPLIAVDNTLTTGGTYTITQTTAGADTATDVDPVPVFPLHADIYLDTTGAGIGVTQMLDIYEMDISVNDRMARTRPINSAQTSDGVIETSDQEHTVGLTFGIDAVERARFAAIRAGSKQFVRVLFAGNTISGANDYTLQFDFCLILTEVGAPEDTDNVATRQWTGRIAYDATWGKAAQITVKNALSGL